MKEFDDHPRYSDLIRELHELKSFIEGIEGAGEDDARPRNRSRELRNPEPDDSAQPASGPGPIALPPDTADKPDDGPPTLREAVHRPRREDDPQLDLLSIGQSAPEEAPAPPAMPSAATPAVEAVDDDTDEVHESKSTGEPPGDHDMPDAEVLAFVYDLSDRILNTIEDKLLERSGDLIPDDLRDELRDAIGELLYQWCER